MNITPVLLCGGSGTRLWPLSRKSFPKQFAKLTGDETLFQSAALRFAKSDQFDFAKPMIVTSSDFRFIVTEQLQEVGIDPGVILIEPEGRNTAAAVLVAAMALVKEDPDAVMLVAPSDHVMSDLDQFNSAIENGLPAVVDGRLVTFGITPTRPETGYGYLKVAEGRSLSGEATPLEAFVEKPALDEAERMLAAKNYLWNAGIFLFRAQAIIDASHKHCPALGEPIASALERATPDLGFLRLDAESWANAPSISIDYAVMEKANNLSVVQYDGGWSDLGSWASVWREGKRDKNEVGLSGPATAIDCENTLLRAESSAQELVGIGLKNIVAVAMPDAVLVADISRSEDVKIALDRLKKSNVAQAESFPRDHRPWGWFESLVIGDRFQVKRIVVNPGGKLSLQSHEKRAEHWVVVQGTAIVTLGDEERRLSENQSIYVPVGVKHRMENRGDAPMILIEVQTGSYLGEDDIVRYDDVYARE